MRPLVEGMTRQDPSTRPVASECLDIFTSLLAKESGISLRWRLRPAEEKSRSRMINDAASIVRECSHIAKWIITGKFITNHFKRRNR